LKGSRTLHDYEKALENPVFMEVDGNKNKKKKTLGV